MIRLFIKITLIITLAAAVYAESFESRYVDTKSGLRMRETPDLNGKAAGLIPDGTEVLLIDETGNNIEISGKQGRWTKIKWSDKTGWVFGGFLSKERKSMTVIPAGDSFAKKITGKKIDAFLVINGGAASIEAVRNRECDAWALHFNQDGKAFLEEDVGLPVYNGNWKVINDTVTVTLKGYSRGKIVFQSTESGDIVRQVNGGVSYYFKLCAE